MNSFEINKIITAILVTILVVFGIGKISDVIFDKDDKNIVAYKVEAPEGFATQASTETSVDISALLALGDVAHGEKVFKKCKACHSIKQGGGNKIGPKLWNVMFRPVGAITEYKYSKALSSVATYTSPISASLAFLKTWEIIETPLIFKRGLPGNLVAESLDGIKITDLDIVFIAC